MNETNNTGTEYQEIQQVVNDLLSSAIVKLIDEQKTDRRCRKIAETITCLQTAQLWFNSDL